MSSTNTRTDQSSSTSATTLRALDLGWLTPYGTRLPMLCLLAWSAVAGAQTAPRPADLEAAVRRWHDPAGSAASCAPEASVGAESRWRCTAVECPGACQVVERVTVLGERNGRWRRVSQERVYRGDTGECGCCMNE